MSSTAPRHRTGSIVLVALAAVLLVAGLALGQAWVERLVPRLPEMPATELALVLATATAIVAVAVALRRGAASARATARRRALQSIHRGEIASGIRNRELVARLTELGHPGGSTAALPSRFSIVADDGGLSFWSGGRRPRRVAHFPWREVRTIRSDRAVVGSTEVPVAVVRVRRAGISVELPVMLSDPRLGRYALTDAPFFATVRSWKARHRAALAAEGLELPPLTGAIPVIRPHAAA
ncbi:hypothetical protein [Agromyces sp. C10]|uniref:hypothetical protein n=1 Tax=Agromyces sp. C10 TaxID=2935077 RepID=UPI00200AB05D|nr:hypothetical protein [Agromyces sp. C10]MCK8608101.1 hypothetical protein [Agromyces sp. C10]